MDRYSLPNKLPFSKKSLPKRVIISYIFDYAIIIVLVLAFTALDRVEPFHQHFSLRNYTLQYPYAEKERVSVPVLGFIAVLCPLVIIVVYTLVLDGLFSHHKSSGGSGSGRRSLAGRYRFKDRLWEMNCGILGLLLSCAAAVTITGALKNATGKPRPDLIDRCRPKEGSVDAPIFGLTDFTICDPKRHDIWKDGFRSFPSGHSSTAFAGLFYLSLYLSAKLHVLDQRGEVWKTFLVLVPTLGAALIADSRIMDARHHPFDVLSGSLLGVVVAWCAYRQYFPPLSEPWKKGRAFPIRSWGREPLHPSEKLGDSLAEDSREPLRDPALVSGAIDPERANYPYPSVAAREDGQGPTQSTDNVFRQQIHKSQRQRAAAGYGGGADDSHLNPPMPTSARQRTAGRSRPDADGYWSSSSDDRDRSNSFELQPQQYGRAPVAPTSPALESFGRTGDTAYKPDAAQAASKHSAVAAAPALTSTSTSASTSAAAPTHKHPAKLEEETGAQPPKRGVDLVETYAPSRT